MSHLRVSQTTLVVLPSAAAETYRDLADFPNDDFNQIMIKALLTVSPKPSPNICTARRRHYWGYASSEESHNEALIKERYQGIRPAPGYPACPEHSEKETLFELLDASDLAGIELTESYAMYPAASVSGWYFSHPDARISALARSIKIS